VGAAVVAAVGGDGTLHEVVNGLVSPDGPPMGEGGPILGAIPVGSGNDYVKMLRVSRTDPRAAALALLDGEARSVDLGLLEGAAARGGKARAEIFLNNLGLAFAGAANARIDSTRGLPGWLAYLVGAGIEFAFYETRLSEVEVDGRVVYKGRPTIVHVNLGRYCGGGVLVTPDAELDDGAFDVFIMGELTRLECLLRWRAVTSGAARTMEDIAILRGRTVAVRGPAGELLHADGEVRRFAGAEVRARVLPRALRVIFAPP
jgi:diacylglycerol kinase family enzyme